MGNSQLAAARMRGDMAEGVARAKSDAEEAEMARALEREATYSESEKTAWDQRFEVRPPTSTSTSTSTCPPPLAIQQLNVSTP